MAKELTDILKAAAEVRDETAMQQNTATRVGGVLTDLAQFVGEAVFAAGMSAKTSAAGVSLLIKYYDADGQPTPFMCGIGGLARGMSWKKNPQPWELSSTPWELSSTASIFDGAGDRKKEMLRKKYHVVRKKTHVVRKIFYVASISRGAASRKNRPPWKKPAH